MVRFHVPDMTCGACANRIGKALQQAGLPREPQVDIDVASRQVLIARAADAQLEAAVRNAIETAGYTVEKMADGLKDSSMPRAGGGYCCASRTTSLIDADQTAETESTDTVTNTSKG